MGKVLRRYYLVLASLLVLLACQYSHALETSPKPSPVAHSSPSSSFEAYKKAQKLRDLHLMAKWGTTREKQHSREALHKLQEQALKRQQRQQQLALKAFKQVPPAGALALASTGLPKASAHTHPSKADKLMVVNINKASVEQLTAALLGVGEVKARAIVDYRKAKGVFKTLDDVLAVKGIGPATIAKNRDRIRFE